MVRHVDDVKDDDRLRSVFVAHVGDGLDTVECWVSFDETLALRVIQVDDDLQAVPDHSVLIEDLNAGPGGFTDAELTAIFHLEVQHIWIGVDE